MFEYSLTDIDTFLFRAIGGTNTVVDLASLASTVGVFGILKSTLNSFFWSALYASINPAIPSEPSTNERGALNSVFILLIIPTSLTCSTGWLLAVISIFLKMLVPIGPVNVVDTPPAVPW